MSHALRDFLDFATETAYLAGRLTLGHFQTSVRSNLKADKTPVTVADQAAEKLIRRRIEHCYPHHAIVGEELGVKENEGAEHRWFIDPIDGTKSFMRGVPAYAVLLGLEIDGVVEVGVAYFPGTDEMLYAATGEGCWWNGRRAHVSDASTLKEAVVTFSNVTSFDRYGRSEEWKRIQQAAYYCRGWGDAYGYLLVATGRAELMLDPVMNAWDCGPFPPILQESGGYFGDWQGNPTIHAGEAMGTTQKLLTEVLAVIGGT